MWVINHFPRKIALNALKFDYKTSPTNTCGLCLRLLSYTSKEYDGNPDPGPIFLKTEVQSHLKTLTRPDLARVYRKRQLGGKNLEQPVYKFLTDKQLEEAMLEIRKKVDDMLQIPPIVSVRKPIDRVLSVDPALKGLNSEKYVFTDITYGVPDSERIIVVRDVDGTLRDADWELRDRVNQIYFPHARRSLKQPAVFEDDNLETVLKRGDFEFILDYAGVQFEPNHPTYQKVVSITYQYVNEHNEFNALRSTRHFGALTFFLAWHKIIDNLLLELLETDFYGEAVSLVQLFGIIHSKELEQNPVESYVKDFSSKKAALELALQAYKNRLKDKETLEEGIKRAHGLTN